MTRRIFRSQVTWQFSVISLVKSSRPDHIVMLCHNAARHRKRLFIDHSFCVRISYYCNNVEYTWISLKVVEFRSLYYILYHSLCNIKWNFLIVIVSISLDNIMDNGDKHTYPPGHVPIDPNLSWVTSTITVRGQPWDCLDNLVGFASASVPTDPRSPRSIVPFPLVRVSITVLHSHIW